MTYNVFSGTLNPTHLPDDYVICLCDHSKYPFVSEPFMIKSLDKCFSAVVFKGVLYGGLVHLLLEQGSSKHVNIL